MTQRHELSFLFLLNGPDARDPWQGHLSFFKQLESVPIFLRTTMPRHGVRNPPHVWFPWSKLCLPSHKSSYQSHLGEKIQTMQNGRVSILRDFTLAKLPHSPTLFPFVLEFPEVTAYLGGKTHLEVTCFLHCKCFGLLTLKGKLKITRQRVDSLFY